jgi:hypothetical protein
MQVVVEEAAIIEAAGWRIKSADLHSLVEQKLNMSGLPKDTIGKAASSLGLGSCSMDRSRARSVTADRISSFKKAVEAVARPTATTTKTTTPPVAKLSQGVVAPDEATPADNSYNTCTTPAVVDESVVPQGQTIPTTATTPAPGYNPKIDCNDPNFPDEDRVEI